MNGGCRREQAKLLHHFSNSMTQYRFITRHRAGKWYRTLIDAQRSAVEIGAGFLCPAGTFTPYRGTILEFRDVQPDKQARRNG